MGRDIVEIGETSKPRFEFRSFGQDFATIHVRIGRLSMPVPEKLWERRSDEIYIVSRADDEHNAKIRHGQLDIKTLVQRVAGFEQWKPRMKGAFPLTASVLQADVLPALQVGLPALPAGPCDHASFLALVRAHPDLAAVHVSKHRFAYQVHDTICEYAVVLINGARVVTVSAESTEIDALQRAINDTHMAALENVNYVQAIKRVIGMIDQPLANG